MPTERPKDDEPDLLVDSGEYPLGGEGIPSLQSIEALRAAAEEALQTAATKAEVADGGVSDYTAEGDMSFAIAADVRKALRIDSSPKRDLFEGHDDPHLNDATRIAASLGEMAVNGTDEQTETDDNRGKGTGDNAVSIEDSASGPHTDRPIGNISLASLAPMLSIGKGKKKGNK